MKDFSKRKSPMLACSEQDRAIAIEENSLLKLKKNRYIEAATSFNTRKAYQSDIRHFEGWGGLLPADIESIVHYLHSHAESLNARTLERRLTALRHWHVYQGFPDPTTSPLIKKTLRGIKNIHGKPRSKAPALTLEHLKQLVAYLEAQNMQGTLSVYRDNALLQVGFFGAFRRSELVAIRYEHLQEVLQGLEIVIPRSKTDPTGEGLTCALPFGNGTLCPVTALKKWLEQSQIKEGYIFRPISKSGKIKTTSLSAKAVNFIIKSLAQACHLPHADKFSGHSLRRGLATSASQQGVPLQAIMRQGRWRHYGTVLGYMEEGHKFRKNAASMILKRSKDRLEERIIDA